MLVIYSIIYQLKFHLFIYFLPREMLCLKHNLRHDENGMEWIRASHTLKCATLNINFHYNRKTP